MSICFNNNEVNTQIPNTLNLKKPGLKPKSPNLKPKKNSQIHKKEEMRSMSSTMTIQSKTTVVTWLLRKLTTIIEKEGSIRNYMDMENKMRRT